MNPRFGRLWLERLLLIGLAMVGAVALAELALRLSGLAPPRALFTVSQQEFERLPGIFQPNQRVHQQPGTEFAHVATIDSLGYRGTDFPRLKPEQELRVLFAGDSFTWGHNVEDNETLPARLEARLVERCPARVVNAGLSGSTILGQAHMVERGLAIDPDLVIIMFHENDIDELVYVRIWEQLAHNRQAKSRFPLSLLYPVVRESAIWNLAQHARRVQTFRTEPVVVQGARTVAAGAEAAAVAARGEYEARLTAVARLLADRGIPLLFAAFPHPESVTSGAGGPHYDWVLDTARGLGLPTVDLLQTLLESGVAVEDAYLVPLDYHPSPRGHAIAAAPLESLVLQQSVARRCSG